MAALNVTNAAADGDTPSITRSSAVVAVSAISVWMSATDCGVPPATEPGMAVVIWRPTIRPPRGLRLLPPVLKKDVTASATEPVDANTALEPAPVYASRSERLPKSCVRVAAAIPSSWVTSRPRPNARRVCAWPP